MQRPLKIGWDQLASIVVEEDYINHVVVFDCDCMSIEDKDVRVRPLLEVKHVFALYPTTEHILPVPSHGILARTSIS